MFQPIGISTAKVTEMTVFVEWRNKSEVLTFKGFNKVTFKRVCDHLISKMDFDPEKDSVTIISSKPKTVILED